MSDNPCSVGALKKALTSGQPPMQVTPNPVLQVLQIKPIAAQANAPERFATTTAGLFSFSNLELVG
jgi:replication factor A1